ncbi:putative ribonuclease H protein [Vitis vinifera]|uniref:Putative ribonuclease H protein n=1 Tax=Vitis vinifera TaxID=29760 RepID=A0A438IEG0_VITVI|nr:putative ribonuclease H protein [Vitis vinifera]
MGLRRAGAPVSWAYYYGWGLSGPIADQNHWHSTEDDLGLKLEMEFIKCREKEGWESSFSSSTLFGRTPKREFCDHSGEIRASLQKENKMELVATGGATASREGCWDLIEINCDALEVQNPEWTPVLTGSQVPRSEKEINWEESSLAKFRKLLGFSIEGVGRFLDWRTLEAAGAAGGVLICWDKRSLEMLEWEEGQFSISYKFRTVENGVVWVFTGVYGPFTKEDRECLWDEFGAIRGLWGEPWCVGGDFNIILSQGERSRQGRVTSAMRRFAQVMDELELIDLPLQGGSFTWSGGLHNQAWARLDRFMVSPSWLDQFSNVTQKRLSRPISDHFPIIIEGGGKRRGPSPFRGCRSVVGLAISWNREVFGNLESNKLAALQQVDYWDQVESERSLTEEEFSRKKEAKEGYAKWVKLEEIHWRQLSRELWLREGDRNTGYFHRMANAHRRRHTMERIKINIGGLNLNQISQQEADILELPFMEEEVHSALMDMNGDKAPGLDGFTGAFWQFCWEFVKEEVLEMFKEFHEHNVFLKSLNTTFLFLSQKKRSGGAGGLQADQSLGQTILDASLIANEVIDSWKKEGEKGLICKLDIEKAHDSVNWQFLMRVMEKMGFGAKGREWIWSCISTAKFSVLVHGEPAGFFSSSKGLRQGDPLSPYLFIMGMEVLSALIRRVVEGGCISGCRIQRGLRINLAKSEIIPVREVNEILEMAVELGCKVERMRWKLALWKRQYISKGGRITLIKSTLASMPLYQLYLFRMPRVVARRLEKLQRDFLWGGGSMERKAHLVNWERVCVGKEKGGLGLRKLVHLNKALHGKWVWRFARAKEEMWKRVLVAKYGQEEFGWRTKKANGAFGVGVGKGTKIRFWKDPWCGDVELARRFPQLFNVAAQRSATVGDLWDQNSGQGGWNLRLIRGFNDWELNSVDELLQILRSQSITLEEDLALWKGGKNGKFDVKEAYGLMISHSTPLFPKKGI